MKTLQTYVKAHIELEYELRRMCNGGDIIQENDGTFKLQIELAKALQKLMYGKHVSKFEFDKKDFNHIDNIFFNKIIVNKIDGENSGYVSNFDCITLNISKDSFGPTLFKVLAHELLYVWQDLQYKDYNYDNVKKLYVEHIKSENVDEDCLVSSEYNKGLSKWVLYLLNSIRK